MRTAERLTAAVTLTFAAFGAGWVGEYGMAVFWLTAPPLITFAVFFLLLRRARSRLAVQRVPCALWLCILVASAAAWLFYFGCVSPPQSYIVGIDEIPPESPAFLRKPWLIHRIYLGFFQSIGGGGLSSVVSISVILVRVLSPYLAIYTIIQLHRGRAG